MRLIYRVLAGIVGTMLGVAGCSTSHAPEEYGPPPSPEYGAPVATYHLTGRVVRAGTDQPIPGVAVAFRLGAADTTDAAGNWSIEAQSGPCDQDCTVAAQDIDGPANGSFEPTTVPVDPEQTEPGDGGWDFGRFEQHGIAIEMDETP